VHLHRFEARAGYREERKKTVYIYIDRRKTRFREKEKKRDKQLQSVRLFLVFVLSRSDTKKKGRSP
jgi:hypothetical protein